jgi:hypothetical protein
MPRKRKTKAGRPIQGAQRKAPFTVMIEPAIAEQLRELGGANLSRGIALAAAAVRK